MKVEAGIKLKDLNKQLRDKYDLALENVGHISEQSLGGAISTSTHGTGIKWGSLSTKVIEMEVMLANGTILIVNAEKTPELFYAFRSGLGCLGVILTVTMQCVNAFGVHRFEYPSGIETAIEEIPVLLQRHDFVKIWWLPHTEFAKVWVHNITYERLPPPTLSQRVRKIVGFLVCTSFFETTKFSLRIISSILAFHFCFINL